MFRISNRALIVWAQCCVLLGAAPAAVAASGSVALLRQFEIGLEDVFDKTSPAVVVIEVELRTELPETEPEPAPDASSKRGGGTIGTEPRSATDAPLRSEGSGFVVRSSGTIMTNFHVVASAQTIVVRLKDGRRFPGRLLGSDERTDVAVVQIEATGLPVLEFFDSDKTRVGQLVCAIGAPFSQEWSFTSGMISGKGRSRLLGPTSAVPLVEDYIQTDAFISPGHSGGPLLNIEGEVIGMNTLITRVERGLAFAVPSNVLQRTLNQILAAGRVSHPWLGIRVESLGDTPSLKDRLAAAGYGAVVLSIEPDGPSFKTDLRPADVVQAMDGIPIRSGMDLQRELFSKKVGQPVSLTVWRNNLQKTLSVATVEIPEQLSRPAVVVPPPLPKDLGNERFGLVLRDVKLKGVRVESVEASSVASRSELLAGDLITDVEGRPVRTANDCLSAIRSSLSKGNGAGAILQIERQGRRTFVLIRAK
ncbi:MAG: trypsin-like peptidase domain-containing protein [Verrucomicrobiota bacterium]